MAVETGRSKLREVPRAGLIQLSDAPLADLKLEPPPS